MIYALTRSSSLDVKLEMWANRNIYFDIFVELDKTDEFPPAYRIYVNWQNEQKIWVRDDVGCHADFETIFKAAEDTAQYFYENETTQD